MSVVIIGGNERMVRRYEDLCKSYDCRAKVFAKTEKGLQNFGNPDLLILFTSTMSHKMLHQICKSSIYINPYISKHKRNVRRRGKL